MTTNGTTRTPRLLRFVSLISIAAIATIFAIAANINVFVGIGLACLVVILAAVGWSLFASPLKGACLLLGLCIVFVDGSFRTNTPGELNVDFQIIAKFSLYLVALICAVFVARRDRLGLIEVLAALYALLLTATVLYAIEPVVALGGAFVLCSQVALAFAVAARVRTSDDLAYVWTVVFNSLLAKIVGSWALLAVSPWAALYGSNPMARRLGEFEFPRFGGYVGPNNMGLTSALVATLSLVSWLEVSRRRARVLAAIAGAVAVVSLVFSQSRTGIAACLAGVLVVTAFRRRRLFYAAVVVTALAAMYLLTYHEETVLGYVTRGRDLESLSSFEGRTAIWRNLERKILEAPFLGYGYGAARVLVPQVGSGGYQEYYAAHNMFLESMINGGVVVTSMLVILIVISAWVAAKTLRCPLASVKSSGAALRALATLSILVTNGMAESGIAGIQTLQTLLFFLVLAMNSAQGLLEDECSNAPSVPANREPAIALQ